MGGRHDSDHGPDHPATARPTNTVPGEPSARRGVVLLKRTASTPKLMHRTGSCRRLRAVSRPGSTTPPCPLRSGSPPARAPMVKPPVMITPGVSAGADAALRCRRPGRTGRLPGQRRLALLLGHDVQAGPHRRPHARTAADHGGQHLMVQALLHTTVSDGRNREIQTSMTAWPPTHPPPHSCRPGRRRVWVLLVQQEGVLSCLPVADSRLPTHRYAMDTN